MQPPQDNIYAPTEVNLERTDPQPDFYVVGENKFLWMFFLTVGFYSVYWFYKNWALYRNTTGERIWPVPRAIFPIFFAHRLCEIVAARLRAREISIPWKLNRYATLYVTTTIISSIMDRMAQKNIGSPVTDIVSLLLLPVTGWALWRIQMAINIASADSLGESNANITWANTLWMILGGICWGLILFGLVAPQRV